MYMDIHHHVELVIYNDYDLYRMLQTEAEMYTFDNFKEEFDSLLAVHLIDSIESPIAKEFTAAIYSNLDITQLAADFYNHVNEEMTA